MFWNICSLNLKLLEPDVRRFVTRFNVICICESWLSDYSNPSSYEIPGYEYFKENRSKISLSGRNSGGVIVYYKESLKPSIKLKLKNSEMIYFMINNCNYFFVYAAGEDATSLLHFPDVFNELDRQIPRCIGPCYAFGDWNGRTGNLKDCNNELNSYLPNRINQDEIINQQGRQLAEFCQTHELVITNGRIGDIENSSGFTYISSRGKSTIDYLLCRPADLSSVTKFYIHSRIESDHMPVSFTTSTTTDIGNPNRTMNCRRKFKQKNNNEECTTRRVKRPRWNEEQRENFKRRVINTIPDVETISAISSTEGVKLVTSTLINAGKTTEIPKTRKTTHVEHPWFNEECEKMKDELKERHKSHKRQRTRASKRSVDTLSKRFTNFKKHLKRKYNMTIAADLVRLKKRDKKEFWNFIGWKNKPSKVLASRNDLQIHFSSLYQTSVEVDQQWVEYVRSFVKYWESNTELYVDTLDRPADIELINLAIKKLKTGKASGPDSTIAEYFKDAPPSLLENLKIIFNKILIDHDFPELWQLQFLCPIFKKGIETDPSNYRGLSIGCIFAKLFLTTVYIRLENYVDENDIIIPEQGGYRKDRSTIDNVFVLFCHIKRAISTKNGRLYCLFVDYSKCFDLINRDFLWYKMISVGLSKNMIMLLKSIYSRVKLSLKLDNLVSDEEIDSTQGVKQGCPLSAILFSLYTNDIVACIGVGLPPIVIATTFMLLFADDTSMFAKSAKHMRQMIKNLENYTDKWGLTVNLDKTKMVLFRKQSDLAQDALNETFTFKGQKIDYVDTYRYLGLTLHYNGTWEIQKSEAKSKALRLTYKLREKLRQCPSLPVYDMKELFITCVNSGLLYGSEIWGTSDTRSLDTVQTSFARYILGLRKKTPNIGALAEVGMLPYKQIATYRVIKLWTSIMRRKIPILYNAYVLVKNLPGWGRSVKSTLNKLGYSEVWMIEEIGDEKSFLIDVWMKIKDCYTQEFDRIIRTMPRLSVLTNLTENPCRISEYLTLLPNSSTRKAMTRFRVSGHKLEIETGRWNKPVPIPRLDRICAMCNTNSIGDELHFLLKCPDLEYLRSGYQKVEPRDHERMYELLVTSDRAIITEIAKFIRDATAARERSLNLL